MPDESNNNRWQVNRGTRRNLGNAVARAAVLPILRGMVWRTAYAFLYYRLRKLDLGFFNYGYAPLKSEEIGAEFPDLNNGEERLGAWLYAAVTDTVDLCEKDIVDVGCGLGGGAAWLKENRAPRNVVGTDSSRRAIQYCKSRYRQNGLEFRRCHALSLDLSDETADVVINVESSHCYRDIVRFLVEIERILRPGGWFVLADFREQQGFRDFLTVLGRTRLNLVETHDISQNVAAALEQDAERRSEIIKISMPWMFQEAVHEFAGLPGSAIHRGLREGTTCYLSLLMQRNPH